MTATLAHRYEPRGACRTLLTTHDPEILVSGPAGTGKSRACLEKLHLMCLRYPGMRGLIVRKTAVSLTSTALVTYRQHVAKEWLSTGSVKWYGGSAQESAQFRYANGSTIVVGGMDNSNRIMSSEYDVIYVQEAIELTETDWEKCTTRLRNGVAPHMQLLADTNPDVPTHWLKARCDRGVTTMLESRHADNPALFEAGGLPTDAGRTYLARLDNLSGVRRSRLRDGLWVAAEGIIWDGYDPAIHLIDKPKPPYPPADWPRYWSIDFGYTNPFVCQRWAVDPDGRLIMYGESYETGKLVEDHARDLKLILDKEPRPVAVICDHDAEDRATLERHLGLNTTAAHKSVSDGLQAVASRLRPDGKGTPRLRIVRNAVRRTDPALVDAKKPTCTADEIPGYVWGNSQTKEAPNKADDHGCDAMRYMVARLDLRRGSRVR